MCFLFKLAKYRNKHITLRSNQGNPFQVELFFFAPFKICFWLCISQSLRCSLSLRLTVTGRVLAAAQTDDSFDVQLCGRRGGRRGCRGVGKSSSARSSWQHKCSSETLPRRRPGWQTGLSAGVRQSSPASGAKGGQVAHHSDPVCSYPQNATQWRRRLCL